MTSDQTLCYRRALRLADLHTGDGRGRARALARKNARGGLVLRTFGPGDSEAFLDLAFLESDSTRYLTPHSSARTLSAVARRILNEYGTFADLTNATPKLGRLDPAWFEACARIEEAGWDWSRWVPPWLVPAVGDERRHSPTTTHYIWEGLHQSLALALGLSAGSVTWQSVEAVVCALRTP